MDWSSIASKVMENYDSTWMDALKKKRAARNQNSPPGDGSGTIEEEADTTTGHSEPDGDEYGTVSEGDGDGDENGDEETKKKLMQLLSE